jgi:hypothetical protein
MGKGLESSLFSTPTKVTMTYGLNKRALDIKTSLPKFLP